MSVAVFFAVAGVGSLFAAQSRATKGHARPAIAWLASGCAALLVAVTIASVR